MGFAILGYDPFYWYQHSHIVFGKEYHEYSVQSLSFITKRAWNQIFVLDFILNLDSKIESATYRLKWPRLANTHPIENKNEMSVRVIACTAVAAATAVSHTIHQIHLIRRNKGGVGGPVVSESSLRTTGILLSGVRTPHRRPGLRKDLKA
ncbi:hypothetical protein PoB_006161400 [Plakobranchus ocellatus]|uniref:Uncharacterized protein n=1 Tax=Plakobranchus ocellatus TaxID=259542 RepID=A0AAV4CTB1_9GAST|nr:hypothetical protein PoB_006161400 [Plakobranchus ocellatus]